MADSRPVRSKAVVSPSRLDLRHAFAGRSLAGRLLRTIFGCYFAVAIVVTAAQMVTEYRHAHQRLEDEIQAMQRTFGRGLADAVWSFNAAVLHGILNGIGEMPVVVGVEVHDEHDRVLDRLEGTSVVRHRAGLFDQPFERVFPLEYVDENGGRHPVGRWVVRSNDGIALDQAKDTLIVILVNSIVKTAALWAIFWFVIGRMVARPLSKVTGYLGCLSATGLAAEPLRLEARDSAELHVLAAALNGFAARLRGAFDDNARLVRHLQEANATLQARVEERTRDLERLAHTDQLTGVSNRRHLDEVLATEAARAVAGSRLSVVIGDIDHFKSINDQHGHAIGDAVIVAFTRVLRGALRPRDVLGRWGGEEFMILCPYTGYEDAGELAEAMRARVAETGLPEAGVRTCSFGVAELLTGEGIDSLLSRADAALYAAKRQGRNRVVVSSSAEAAFSRGVALS